MALNTRCEIRQLTTLTPLLYYINVLSLLRSKFPTLKKDCYTSANRVKYHEQIKFRSFLRTLVKQGYCWVLGQRKIPIVMPKDGNGVRERWSFHSSCMVYAKQVVNMYPYHAANPGRMCLNLTNHSKNYKYSI